MRVDADVAQQGEPNVGRSAGREGSRQTRAVRYVVDVEGTEVRVERPWSRRPRLLVDGDELASDRWGRRLLDMPDGSQQEVRIRYDAFFLGPRLEVAGKHYPVGRRLPRWVLVALIVFTLLGVQGGAVGALLALGGSVCAARLLIHPQRRRRHVVAAVAVLMGAVAAYLLVVQLIAIAS